jgi:hypothetical protein
MCSDNRKMLMACINVATARIMFLKAAHNILKLNGS